MTTRELAAIGAAQIRKAPRPPRLAAVPGRKLRLMPLPDGRCNLVETKTNTLFMPCASRPVAERMRDVFSA